MVRNVAIILLYNWVFLEYEVDTFKSNSQLIYYNTHMNNYTKIKNGRFKRAALTKAVVHKIRGEAWGDWGAWEARRAAQERKNWSFYLTTVPGKIC
jgi:hypothetical protein